MSYRPTAGTGESIALGDQGGSTLKCIRHISQCTDTQQGPGGIKAVQVVQRDCVIQDRDAGCPKISRAQSTNAVGTAVGLQREMRKFMSSLTHLSLAPLIDGAVASLHGKKRWDWTFEPIELCILPHPPRAIPAQRRRIIRKDVDVQRASSPASQSPEAIERESRADASPTHVLTYIEMIELKRRPFLPPSTYSHQSITDGPDGKVFMAFPDDLGNKISQPGTFHNRDPTNPIADAFPHESCNGIRTFQTSRTKDCFTGGSSLTGDTSA